MHLEILDTTLRDGTQGENINLTLKDKLLIAEKLDDFGIDIIEGGWPGSNPKDSEFFYKVQKLRLNTSQICAFGSTARNYKKISEDENLNALLFTETPVVTIFGKTWQLHSKHSLNLSDDENAELIYKSVEYLKTKGRRVIFDAEHFFDGFKDNKFFAIKMLEAAEQAGADLITLCDTNGGSLPVEIETAVSKIIQFINVPLGIHAHNDCGLGVANSLAAVRMGITHIQGTVNGLGERCGNANLCSLIPILNLKLKNTLNPLINLEKLSELSNYIYEIMNLVPDSRAPFTGLSAFTHKGGIHVSAVLKDSRMYEHIQPEKVGNYQRVLVSDLSGVSNLKYKIKRLGIEIENTEVLKKLLDKIKKLEYGGYQFESSEASFELLLRRHLNLYEPYFKIASAKLNVMFDEENYEHSEAVLKLAVGNEIEHTASEGAGPVSAIDNALKKALIRFFPDLNEVKLIDYKVRVLTETTGSAAKVRVLIRFTDGVKEWSASGVSENIIQASLKALADCYNYKLMFTQKYFNEDEIKNTLSA